MKFLEIINKEKLTLFGIFLFLYFLLNLIDGERGLISYYKKKNEIKQLYHSKNLLTKKLNLIEKKNNLLTGVVDMDYLETLYRTKFLVGKKGEKIYLE
jgi:cell division protein DivIC